ncbi:hypothetical protein K502DRAFT_290806 [Neoconidiobolus thromboides FSU 785]|nr:hypothetical protein K502DRAFT_290806 [Neoconidiobolus thromboides FSU 785]
MNIEELTSNNQGKQGRGNQPSEAELQAQQAAREEILSTILDFEARERLNRVKMVKSERALEIENKIIYLAKTGQLRNKVSEPMLIQMLDGGSQNSNKENNQGKIRFQRKRYDDEEEEEFDL